ncbi:LTA synthase family protein [Adlercreutzia sp. R21]|uniref:LTA synthase family protein n=1 Tax=Adlercreutzia wanghongyangiae TaxID=3111451 RepID=UPI002DBC7565|nr:LTA synthase family protein [Adlercreutzia sp. R21]MEC4183210.1 LTA synthase family protein [Adlercreutzia sp. R21]
MTESQTAPERREKDARIGGAATAVRAGFFVLAVVLGYVLIALPWGDGPFSMNAAYVLPNLLIATLAAGVVFLAGQRTRASLAVFVGLCLLVGTANFFIIEFKGQPIVPADLFALSTAASVAGGYTLFLTPRLVLCLGLFAAFCVALVLWCPKRPLTGRAVAVNCIAAVALAACGVVQYQTVDLKEAFQVKVDVWDVRGSYASQGTLLCFLSRAQELTPRPPAGYSAEAAADVLAPFAAEGDGVPADQALAAVAEGAPYDRPNVIAIMNETFSDLSAYPGMEDAARVTEQFRAVAADSLAAGDVYVSAMGGGTCNSEFEFLTGASMGNMGGGVYPYVLYDVDGVDNLASYFRDLGYGTHAIHPAEASNWRRDRIYEQLGFDEFDDITTMEDADTFRDLVTDKATYERALQKIDEEDGPQFVFDVTIQNHGGYDTGLVPPEDAVRLESETVDNPEVNEFLAAIKRSDDDLRWLVDELNARDEPTIVVFFGDHQPGFADWLFETTFGKSVDDASLEEVQQRYRTPYFIWVNEAARQQYGNRLQAIADADATSLNYLRSLLVEAAGLPADAAERYRENLREALPAMNLNGYCDAEGMWHWFGEDVTSDAQQQAETAREGYAIVQYDQLFGKQ